VECLVDPVVDLEADAELLEAVLDAVDKKIYSRDMI
jgi:hypothetical protein